MKKPERAGKMVDYALDRVKAGDTARKETLLALKQEVIDFTAAVKRHVSRTTYHFGNLPVEISHEIFSLLVDSDHAIVVILASVCNTWRSVVLASPSFWSTLVLTKKHPAKKARLWIQRSGGQILNLRFVQGCAPDPTLRRSLQGLQWETLRALDAQANVVGIVELVRSKFSQLDQLQITEVNSAHELLRLLHAVQTRNLEIRGINLSFRKACQILTDCRTLSFHSISGATCHLSDVIHAISENPNLTTLSISFIGPLIKDIPLSQLDNTTLELPKLLQLDLKSNRSLWGVLCGAIMPSLVSLSLSDFVLIDDHLANFLTRYPTTSLTDLTVSCCPVSHLQIISLLRASPHLRTVTLEGIPDINEVVEFLAATQLDAVQGLPCSLLEKVDLTSCTTLRSGPIVRLIKERATSGDMATIGTLIVDYCPLIDPEVRDWLGRIVPSFSCIYTRKRDAWKR